MAKANNWKLVIKWRETRGPSSEADARAEFENFKNSLNPDPTIAVDVTVELREGPVLRDYFEASPKP